MNPQPFREMPRREQQAAYRELTRSPGPLRTLDFRIHAVKFAVFFLLLYFMVRPLIERDGGGMFLPLLLFIVIAMVTDELIWRFYQVRAVEKELEKRSRA